MAIFIVLWPYLLTTKLRCLQKTNIGHTSLERCFFMSKKRKLSAAKYHIFFSSKRNKLGIYRLGILTEIGLNTDKAYSKSIPKIFQILGKTTTNHLGYNRALKMNVNCFTLVLPRTYLEKRTVQHINDFFFKCLGSEILQR